MTPEERKIKVHNLRKEHQKFFSSHERLEKDDLDDALYIPKMAYRPSGKDELFVSFFPSELQKGKDIYTEFVSIDYDSEDPKRTLYLWEYNEHWEQEYELITSSSGFERHIIPASELKIINDVNSRKKGPEFNQHFIESFEELPNPDNQDKDPIVTALNKMTAAIDKLTLTIYKKHT